jgi:hypothetical protein
MANPQTAYSLSSKKLKFPYFFNKNPTFLNLHETFHPFPASKIQVKYLIQSEQSQNTMILNFLKQIRIRGIIYAVIAITGIIYEIFISKEVRPFLLVMYSLVIVIGIFYFLRAPE